MDRKQSHNYSSHMDEINEKIADQTYWVNQVKQNPEEFEEYLGRGMLRKSPEKDIFENRYDLMFIIIAIIIKLLRREADLRLRT
jgi:hypothetical protein